MTDTRTKSSSPATPKSGDTPKALGQHMLKNQPQEFRPGQGSSPHLFRFTVPVTVVVFI
jgi:hypothetical protein